MNADNARFYYFLTVLAKCSIVSTTVVPLRACAFFTSFIGPKFGNLPWPGLTRCVQFRRFISTGTATSSCKSYGSSLTITHPFVQMRDIAEIFWFDDRAVLAHVLYPSSRYEFSSVHHACRGTRGRCDSVNHNSRASPHTVTRLSHDTSEWLTIWIGYYLALLSENTISKVSGPCVPISGISACSEVWSPHRATAPLLDTYFFHLVPAATLEVLWPHQMYMPIANIPVRRPPMEDFLPGRQTEDSICISHQHLRYQVFFFRVD